MIFQVGWPVALMDACNRGATEMNIAINDVCIVEVEPSLVPQIYAVCRGGDNKSAPAAPAPVTFSENGVEELIVRCRGVNKVGNA
jgi:hypothetical protein